VTPDAVAQSGTARRRLRSRRAVAVRSAAHLAAWTPFIFALIRALHHGWKPVSDSAVIALRSWDALSAHGLLVGEVTRLAHGVYDLGPLEFWLLTLPVHLDPAHGVLWGGTVWCTVAASLAIEAAWAAAGELGAVLASGTILGIVAWIPKIAMLPDWNPWFGMMFFMTALAAGWAVLSGCQKWWPVLAITGSVAAQAHLMYAIAAACLLIVGFIAVIVDSLRSRKYRWAIIGIIAGLACWIAPLIQQFTARTGNMTQLIDTLRAGSTARAGLSFGLKALSAATQPPAYWWKPSLEALKLSTIDQRAVWFGVVQLAVTTLVLIVAIFVLRSRRAAAPAALSLLTCAAALETYSGIPAWNLWRPVTDLSYLMAPMLPIGVLAWLAAGYVLVLATWRAVRWLRTRGATRQPVSGRARDVRIITAPWGLRIAGFAAVALMVVLTTRAAAHIGGALRSQSAARNAVSSASTKIEREISARRIVLAVVAPNNNYRRQVTIGLAYALRSAGYTPEISSSWTFQIGPAYYYDGNPGTQVTVFVHNHGVKTRVVITDGPRVSVPMPVPGAVE
jgi:hypothetical protein